MRTVQSGRLVGRFVVTTFFIAVPSLSTAGGWYIAPDFTLTHLDSDSYVGSESSLGISLGRRFSNGFDVEASYGKQQLELKDIPDRLERQEFLLGARWAPDHEDTPNLYLSGGIGGAHLEYLGDNFFAPTAFVGLGYRLSLPWTERFDLLGEGRLRYSRIDDAPGQKDVTDSQAVVKLRYTFSPAVAQAAAAPYAPVAPDSSDVRPAKASSYRETCAGLPKDSDAFKAYRCELFDDSDGDGVPDTKDRCRNTIAGVSVDVEGCMIRK